MFSSAEHFADAGGGDNHLMMQNHNDQDSVGQMYHVPQHSRREKLRFPQEEQLPPSPHTPLLLLNDPNAAVAAAAAPIASSVAPFYHANSLTPFLPSSSSSSSPPCSSNSSTYYYSNQNPGYGCLAPAIQYVGHEAFAGHLQQTQHQISNQAFSLSLSSSSQAPPRPLLGSRPAPIGPFTGYSAVLSRSRYLEPARKLLDEVCQVGHAAAAGGDGAGDKEMMLLDADASLDLSAQDEGTCSRKENCDPVLPNTEQQWKKTRLISMLDEVYRRYKQYYLQVQAVITSFEAVAGLSNAAPFALMALKAMSKHFRSLKNIISGQLHQANKVLGNGGPSGREETSSFGILNGSGGLQRTSAYHPGAFSQPHVWRPQRGLPERAVAVLRAWLFEHFLHPYPTDTDKQILAKQTGLTRNQVSNWFINARVRLWKPMVEEIHSLETRQKNKVASTENDCNTEQKSQIASSSNATPCSSQLPQIASNHENDCSMAKNFQEELIQMPNHIQQQPMSFSYDNLSNPHHFPVGISGVGSGRNASVSLTLGLHQDSGINFPEQLPLNVARRFGLEECSDTYVVNSFGGQERLFPKDASGRLLHDFVG